MKPNDFATITSLAAPGSEIGMRGGERGLATPEDSQMAAWLARRSPEDVDRVARSRASQHSVELRTRTEWRYPQDRPSYEVLVQCQADGTDEDLARFAADVSRLLAPAPIREIEGWLAELSVIVARRPQEEVDEAVRLTAYASRLSLYPADVVRHVLLVLRWKFWPTWDELAAVCDGLSTGRKAMIAAAKAPRHEAAPAPAFDPEKRDRVRAVSERYLVEKAAEDRRATNNAKRLPHWSETAAPDDPRWRMLRQSREASGLAPRHPVHSGLE